MLRMGTLSDFLEREQSFEGNTMSKFSGGLGSDVLLSVMVC